MTSQQIKKRIEELEELIQKKHKQIEEMQSEIIDIEITICNDSRMIDTLIQLQVENGDFIL